MTSIINVAKYILNECGEMTTMKLQKLCYYVQAWYLAWEEEPLFEDNFEAWANGPVNPSLYSIHKGKFHINKNDLKIDDYNFSELQLENMNRVIEYYCDFTPQELSNLTHTEEPWKNARRGVAPGMPSSNIIDKESMLQFYSGL